MWKPWVLEEHGIWRMWVYGACGCGGDVVGAGECGLNRQNHAQVQKTLVVGPRAPAHRDDHQVPHRDAEVERPKGASNRTVVTHFACYLGVGCVCV